MIKKTVLFFLCFTLFLSIPGCKKKLPTQPDIPEVLKPTINYFLTLESTIKLGDSTTLYWDTFNAMSVSINQGIGTVTAKGEIIISPLESTIYTLTATNNAGSKTSTAQVMISRWAVVELSLNPPAPIVYFHADGTSTSDFSVIVTETNGVGGRIDTIRIIGTPPLGSSWSQAFEGGTFSANGSFSRYCSMFLYCWPEHILVKAEGVDMHGYTIDVGISFFIIWYQNTGTMKFLEVVYGANHHKLIK